MTQLQFDMDVQLDFLVGLLNTPSPTGYTDEAIEYVRHAFNALGFPGLSLHTTRKGSLLIQWQGDRADAPLGMTAHVDTLGFMVKEIKPNGRLKLTNLGGILWNGVEGEGVTVCTADGRRVRGSLLLENTSIHVNRDARRTDRGEDTMEVRLDARTTSHEETAALGIEVGDFVCVDPRVEVGEAGFVRSRFLDDKAGVANLYAAAHAVGHAGLRPIRDTYILISTYEEIGHGGAAGLPGDLAEMLTVDMGALGPGQAGDEFSVSICAKDAGGPYDRHLVNRLRDLARQHDIAHNVDIYPYYNSDGTAYWRAGGGARVGLLGPGVDASHAYERTHREALNHTAHLLARYMLIDRD